ncbi:hypothetical protein AVEN_191041-1 [Araneus ventricosus]|uniref:DUF1758 domain-containing protein n=1 Tax=Araneus ventricosus TaxID=182803 RepID=A0A4Y2AYC9_ARAVE|nr:hypothetical protein AVEN_191041-1 [Araneus ventricosus]
MKAKFCLRATGIASDLIAVKKTSYVLRGEFSAGDCLLITSGILPLPSEFEDVFDAIYTACDETLIDSYVEEQESILENIDETYLTVVRKFKTSNCSSSKTEVSDSVKLAKLSLPAFTGNINEWITFKDLFNAAVNNNSSLSDSQRLTYLKLSLKCILDSASQKSYIKRSLVKKLGLNVKNKSISVSCLGAAETIASGEIDFTFTPHFNQKFHGKTSAFLIEKITDNIPTINLPQSLKDSFSDLLLADPNFHNASEIDVLLGVNVFLSLMKGETIKRDERLPFALSTKLGWVIAGSTAFPVENLEETSVSYLSVNTEELIQSFWELEQIPMS